MSAHAFPTLCSVCKEMMGVLQRCVRCAPKKCQAPNVHTSLHSKWASNWNPVDVQTRASSGATPNLREKTQMESRASKLEHMCPGCICTPGMNCGSVYTWPMLVFSCGEDEAQLDVLCRKCVIWPLNRNSCSVHNCVVLKCFILRAPVLRRNIPCKHTGHQQASGQVADSNGVVSQLFGPPCRSTAMLDGRLPCASPLQTHPTLGVLQTASGSVTRRLGLGPFRECQSCFKHPTGMQRASTDFLYDRPLLARTTVWIRVATDTCMRSCAIQLRISMPWHAPCSSWGPAVDG